MDLPHFDGAAIPQFITFNLADAIPLKVIDRWKQELAELDNKEQQILLQRRIDRYLDQGYGNCYLKDPKLATLVEESLLKDNGIIYDLFSWVVMPNHTHSLLRRFEDVELSDILKAHKGRPRTKPTNCCIGMVSFGWRNTLIATFETLIAIRSCI